MFKKPATLVLLPDKRPWKVRQREDLRIRDRRGYKRPDTGRKRDRRGYKRPDAGKRPKTHSGATGLQRLRGYKRLGAGKRPETRRSTTSRGNKQRTWRAKNNQRMKREGVFIVKEREEEGTTGYKRPDADCRANFQEFCVLCRLLFKTLGLSKQKRREETADCLKSPKEPISKKAPRACNKPFGCGMASCDQCYPPGDALGRRSL